MRAKLENVSDADFERVVIDHEGLVMVGFWASWCGQCRLLTPTLEQIQDEFKPKVKIVKLNIDENRKTAAELEIEDIPSLILFREGQKVDQLTGNLPRQTIVASIQKFA